MPSTGVKVFFFFFRWWGVLEGRPKKKEKREMKIEGFLNCKMEGRTINLTTLNIATNQPKKGRKKKKREKLFVTKDNSTSIEVVQNVQKKKIEK
ncbi:hypothetical protein RFI_08865 [Reticulomyxa filosa]|uniref:Uncharacterized protein n=1 Tax=Reticulomyxa filosa TaxID=46433 RepID=X6NRA9_RETFI|nr:hypothetical protein RFI_08865 [Reticulomyxa filosa]|eukprot:ETO28264.1 hypothetical protein RFI_08865 [Reticulomyxa filosa]